MIYVQLICTSKMQQRLQTTVLTDGSQLGGHDTVLSNASECVDVRIPARSIAMHCSAIIDDCVDALFFHK